MITEVPTYSYKAIGINQMQTIFWKLNTKVMKWYKEVHFLLSW